MTPSGKTRAFLAIVILSLAALAIAPWIGMREIGWSDATGAGDPLLADIFWKLRAPRTIAAFIAGCGLALGGAAFQALFRNPLAEPFTLGVSSGASAGAALAVFLGSAPAFFGVLAAENVYAFAGALAAVCVVYAFSRLKPDFNAATLLLSGVAASFFFSNLVLLAQHLASPADAARIVRALSGGVAGAGMRRMLLMLPFAFAGALATAAHARELDIIACGEELALTRGVDTAGVRKRLFVGVSLMVGGITALCGPIGFVGLVAPHICRMLVGPEHRRLLPASACLGGMLLVLADLAGRTAIAPAELPAGVITSLCGAPFFLWLLVRSR